jgi:hypothetical protein
LKTAYAFELKKNREGHRNARTADWIYIKHRSSLFVLLIPQLFPQKAKIDRLSTQCAILLSAPWYYVAENGRLHWYGYGALDQTLEVSVCFRTRLQHMEITVLGRILFSCAYHLPLIPNKTLYQHMVGLALLRLLLKDRKALSSMLCLGKARRGSINLCD